MVVRAAVAARERGLVTTVLQALAKTLLVLFGSLLLSILVEWLGMAMLWQDQGVAHSRWLLEQEASFIARDFRQSFFQLDPVRFAVASADLAYIGLFKATRLVDLIHFLEQPVPEQNTWLGVLRVTAQTFYRPTAQYVEAALNMTQVFALRLAVLILSLPLFLLFSLVAVVDGLVERDLRRWGLGDESAFLYHPTLKAVKLVFLAAWLVYLSLPTSVHPNIVIVPFAVMVAWLVGMSVSKFKKYL